MTTTKMPLLILGGRDRKVTTLPKDGRDKKVLHGYKAVDIEIGGRPFIDVLVRRIRDSGHFDPIYIAGPSEIYKGVVEGVRIVDTDGSLGQNLGAVVRAMAQEQPGRQVMFTTCDVLLDRQELADALEDFQSHQPLDFWMTQIRLPEDLAELGESAWKPKYRIQPTGEEGPVGVLPGHLIAVDPGIADTDLILRVFAGLYSTRNRPVSARYTVIARQVLLKLFADDLRSFLRFRWPSRTWTVVLNCLAVGRKLRAGLPAQRDIEDRLRRIFIKPEHRKEFPDIRGRVAVIEGLSLAKDIDTEEEAREIARANEVDGAKSRADRS